MGNKEIIRNYISKLKTVKTKAFEEKVTTACIYSRIKAGRYKCTIIDGITFIED